MTAEKMETITESEAALYDRQIRLWGIESQQKLRNAKILIIGMKGFGAEIAKNIILCGVKSVTLLDNASVTVEDSSAQFLIPAESIGQNRAEASVKRAQALNPMVAVTADTSNVGSKNDEYFANFDVVIATRCPFKELKRINTACRLNNVKFYAGDVFGMFGYFFADLLIHEFVEDKVSIGKEKIVTSVKRSIAYFPLVDTVGCDWTKDAKRLSKMDPSYFVFLIVQEFLKENGRVPDRCQRDADFELLKQLKKSVLDSISVPDTKVPDSLFLQVFGEVSPVSAIVGGVLAQDVIKTVSQKGAPVDNFFFFNPERCCGLVEKIAASA